MDDLQDHRGAKRIDERSQELWIAAGQPAGGPATFRHERKNLPTTKRWLTVFRRAIRPRTPASRIELVDLPGRPEKRLAAACCGAARIRGSGVKSRRGTC
jgi:hypothetical protein